MSGPTTTPGYRMLLPAGWVRLPANPVQMRPLVRALLLELWSDQPRDATVTRRRALEQELCALGDQSMASGGRELLLSLRRVGDLPLSASAVVSLVPSLLRGEDGLQELALAWEPKARQSEVADLGRNRGVVVVRDQRVESLPPLLLQDTGGKEAELTAALSTTRQVDVYLPVPDEPVFLLLSFSTPLRPLFEPYTELFVALASTVQWR